MREKMWCFFLKLSANMWGDPGSSWIYSPFRTEMITEDEAWRKVVDFLPAQGFNTVLIDVGDGIQYESHPEVSVKGAWSKEKVKKELAYMRSLGLTPIPKLNFSTGHDAWLKDYSRMVSTPIYYQVCEDIIKEVAEVFDYPKYFHLGMDEEKASMQEGLSYCCIRQGDLWWHDAYFFFDICEKLGMRPWVWADACWDNMDTYLKKMPKSVVQSNWAYHQMRRNPDGTCASTKYKIYMTLDEHGYDQIPTSSTWEFRYNTKETMELSKNYLSEEHLLGHMTVAWQFTTMENLYALLNDAWRFGYAKKAIYPEV